MGENITKIFVVSLIGMRKYKGYAVYDNDTEDLIITHILPITGIFRSWQGAMVEEIKTRQADGFICLVEETTDFLSQYATSYNLEDMNEDAGKTNLYEALNLYYQLSDLDKIHTGKEYERFLIRTSGEGQKIERTTDDKGRPVYSVNWAALTGGHRVVLLCVIAALSEPVSERYVTEMLNLFVGANKPKLIGAARGVETVRKMVRRREREFEARVQGK